MADDIGPGDIVQCIEQPQFNVAYSPPWSFPPEVGSIWTVETVHPAVYSTITGQTCSFGGVRLVGDALQFPGAWPIPLFRKLCGPIDAAAITSLSEDLTPTPVKERT